MVFILIMANNFMTLVNTSKVDAENKEIGIMLRTAKEDKEKAREEILDGDRFSESIEKVTGSKHNLKTAANLRNKSSERVIKLGIISPDEIIDANQKLRKKETERQLAETDLSEATGFKVSNFERLSKDDVKFINELSDDGTKDIVIRELFGKKILKSYKNWLVDNQNRIVTDNTSKDMQTEEGVEFVRLYVENYNTILEGKSGTPLNELAKQAGFEGRINTTQLMANPWIASKIELYHKAVEKMSTYHYQQIEDRRLREKSRVQDLKDTMLNHYAANPDKLTDGKLGDQARMMKTLDELSRDKKDKGGGPAVAIQINSDVANLATIQNKEKEEHMRDSFI